MSREDYEMIKRMSDLQHRGNHGKYRENDELIIEENTIYELDLECYENMLREKSRYLLKESERKSSHN